MRSSISSTSPWTLAASASRRAARSATDLAPVAGGDSSGPLGPAPALAMAQSSGILIQPWRIAYTTAWVRSLTASLRRMELMWFFTVCSLIESA